LGTVTAAESTPQPQGECPAGISREQCAQIVAAAEAAAGGSEPMPLETCPSNISQAQCEAVMKASAEALEANR
jgi:hypothetical protein